VGVVGAQVGRHVSTGSERRVRIADNGLVRGTRTRVQLAEQRVVARAGSCARNGADRIIQVAEDDGAGRARGLAGGNHLAVGDRTILTLGLDARGADALDAVRTLLHHAAAADRDIRIAQQLQGGRVEVAVLEEVETADLVRTVVGAVARADAAVVDHVVQALVAMHRGADRTYDFARRVL